MDTATTRTSRSDDVSARDRIRDAAIVEFAERGVAGTSLKAIATRADVSQGLIVHHFGSKDGLREACDAYVAAVISKNKHAQVHGPGFDPIGALRATEEARPLMRYLGRTLGDGHPQVATIVDEMIADAVTYMAEGERNGIIKPSDYPRERAAILVLWSLGMLTLHEHLDRHLGIDLFGDTAQLANYLLPASELLSHGVIADGVYEQLRTAFEHLDGQDAP
jgi:AcrR family transcriptional regulator